MSQKDLRNAYHPGYFSIDNILACQTLIQCKTEMSIPKFGFLVSDCNSEDLPAGMELQLPLWAARILCRPGRKYISANIPPGFKDVHRQVIDNEPTDADLKKVHSQYFEAGHLCTSLYHYDAGELAEMLPEILQQRLLCIGDATVDCPEKYRQQLKTGKEIPTQYLDQLEEKIHEDSKQGTEYVKDWLEPLDRPLNFPITRSQPKVQPPPQQQQTQHHHYINNPAVVNPRPVAHNQYATQIATGPTQMNPYQQNFQAPNIQAPVPPQAHAANHTHPHYYHQHMR